MTQVAHHVATVFCLGATVCLFIPIIGKDMLENEDLEYGMFHFCQRINATWSCAFLERTVEEEVVKYTLIISFSLSALAFLSCCLHYVPSLPEEAEKVKDPYNIGGSLIVAVLAGIITLGVVADHVKPTLEGKLGTAAEFGLSFWLTIVGTIVAFVAIIAVLVPKCKEEAAEG